MSDFKVGDIVYWFEYPEQCLGFTQEIALNKSIVSNHYENSIGIKEGGCISLIDVDIYHSRREAINALAARLKVLLDEE